LNDLVGYKYRVIAFFNGNKSVLKEISEQIDSIALSVLVIAELDYGARASQKAKENLKKLYRFVDIIQAVPFDLECAKIFGTIKSKLRKLGKPTGEMDALIDCSHRNGTQGCYSHRQQKTF
jgi:tRNA(fMet)-specific endonuclease VapC